MGESTAAIPLFSFLALSFSVGCHYFLASYLLACLASTLLTVIFAQLAFYMYYGFVDPFVAISSMSMGIVAFIVSLIVGLLPFLRKRRETAKPALNRPHG